ncbi:uncharacterized protein TNCV_517131 [Trichonephila clavipes]|nr:uncharacterized protein TNCV_517131 [Trichonephila clavipes]
MEVSGHSLFPPTLLARQDGDEVTSGGSQPTGKASNGFQFGLWISKSSPQGTRFELWFEIFGYSLETATDFTRLKEALTENFPLIRNKTELEVRLHSSYRSRSQASSDDRLKIHKRLGLNMSEEGLVEHIIARLEPQLMEYVAIRNPTSRSQLLKMITKYEDRYLRRDTQAPSNSNSER